MKNIKISILFLLANCILISSILAQNKQREAKSVRINNSNPTVFITFERSGNVKSDSSEKGNKRIWLRFHNNTPWNIWIHASGGDKEYEDASLYYDILNDKENLEKSFRCHLCSITSIAKGKSLLFSIPNEDFTEGLSLRLSFSYDWEQRGDIFDGREPTHYVYFFADDLPKEHSK